MKIDQKCLSLCAEVDCFLSLEVLKKGYATPTDFWKELDESPETVSSYLVCLITKLISLDTGHGMRPLPEAYRELAEMAVDITKFKHWSSSEKPIPAQLRNAALELQHKIISTIHFIKEFYGYVSSTHLRHMYLVWNLARNTSFDGTRKAADCFEEKVLSAFSLAESKKILHSPKHEGLTYTEEDQVKAVCAHVEDCYQKHRRAFFGILPPDISNLCNYACVADSLSYSRLKEMVSRNPRLLTAAVKHIIHLLKTEVSQNQEHGETEVLLPLLHMFKEFVTMTSDVNIAEAYQVVYPFYMWPLAYAESAKKTLDVVLLEMKSRGSAFRRRMLLEQDLGLATDKIQMVRHQAIHVMVDMSLSEAKAPLLFEIFNNKQEKLEPVVLKKLLIRNVFKSVFPSSLDIVELEQKLQKLSPEVIHKYTSMAVEKMEEAANKGGDIDVQNFLSSEMNKLYLAIMQERDHRDSISSVNSPDATFLSSFAFPELSEDLLSSFALPVPYTQAHALSSSDMDVVSVKLKEVIVKCQQQDQRPHSVLDHSRSVDRPHMLTSSLFSDSSSTTLTNGAGTGDQVTSPDFDRAISPTSDSLSTSLDDPDGMRCSSALSKNSTQSEDTGLPSSDLIQRDPCCALPKKGSVSRESSKSPDSSKYNGRTDTPDETSSKDSSLVGSRRGSKADMSKSIQDTDMYIDSVFDLDVSAEEACDTPKAESKLFRKGSMDTASRDLSIYSTESAARKPHPLLKRRDTELSIRTPLDSKPVAIIGRSGEGSLKSKRYASISAGSGGTLRGVKPRSNPTATLSMKKVKRPELSTGVFSPAKKVNTKMLKLVLAGNDCLVSSVAHAYCHLLLTEPSLFSGLEILFYYIPLCQASTIYGHTGEIPQMGTNADLPEPFCATTDLTGNTIHIARFLSYLDSWYERNVMLAVHNTLRIIPTDKLSSLMQRFTSPQEGDPTTTPRGPLHPSKVLLNVVSSYCREASHTIRVKMLRIKMSIKTEKSKILHQETYMMHRFDIQRLSGKKSKDRQVKTFDANITITQLALDGSFIRSEMKEELGVWIVRASNIPRAGDSSVCNPESESFELSIIQAITEGGRLGTTKYRFARESLYHAYDLVLETRDKPISVMIDGNSGSVVDNVIRMEVSPVYTESTSTSRLSDKQERQVFFPLMTFWPVDL